MTSHVSVLSHLLSDSPSTSKAVGILAERSYEQRLARGGAHPSLIMHGDTLAHWNGRGMASGTLPLVLLQIAPSGQPAIDICRWSSYLSFCVNEPATPSPAVSTHIEKY